MKNNYQPIDQKLRQLELLAAPDLTQIDSHWTQMKSGIAAGHAVRSFLKKYGWWAVGASALVIALINTYDHDPSFKRPVAISTVDSTDANPAGLFDTIPRTAIPVRKAIPIKRIPEKSVIDSFPIFTAVAKEVSESPVTAIVDTLHSRIIFKPVTKAKKEISTIVLTPSHRPVKKTVPLTLYDNKGKASVIEMTVITDTPIAAIGQPSFLATDPLIDTTAPGLPSVKAQRKSKALPRAKTKTKGPVLPHGAARKSLPVHRSRRRS